MALCIGAAIISFPTAKIAAMAFIFVALGMYTLAHIVDKYWDKWFDNKETS
jgi:hypothetical protein